MFCHRQTKSVFIVLLCTRLCKRPPASRPWLCLGRKRDGTQREKKGSKMLAYTVTIAVLSLLISAYGYVGVVLARQSSKQSERRVSKLSLRGKATDEGFLVFPLSFLLASPLAAFASMQLQRAHGWSRSLSGRRGCFASVWFSSCRLTSK